MERLPVGTAVINAVRPTSTGTVLEELSTEFRVRVSEPDMDYPGGEIPGESGVFYALWPKSHTYSQATYHAIKCEYAMERRITQARMATASMVSKFGPTFARS